MIRVKSLAEFDWLIEHTTHEAHRARDNWDFLGAIDKAFDEYLIELNETPAFWELMRRANQDMVILRLVRLYDPNRAATSLGNLLQTMKEKASRPDGVTPASIVELDATQLDSEIATVSGDDATVLKLLRIRNEYLAHRGTQHVIKGTYASLPTLKRDELSTLITRALDLVHKYRELLGYQPLLWGHHEKEQFYRLLSLVREGCGSRKSVR